MPQSELEFQDIFDLEYVQKIQDAFAKATGVASIITRTDGSPLTRPSNFCRLCMEVIRATEEGRRNCYKSDAVLGRYNPDGPTIQPCLSGGLWDAGASITVGGRHIANWLIGQVRNEHQDEERMLAYAESIGADTGEFMKALSEVPFMTTEQFRNVSEALFVMANELSEKAYQNLRLAQTVREREDAVLALAENRRVLETVLNTVPQSIFWKDRQSVYQGCNQAFARTAGLCDTAQVVGKTDFDLPWLPEQSEAYRADDRKVVKSGKGKIRYVEGLVQADGSRRWIETSKMPLADEAGEVVGVLGIFDDITLRRDAEEAAARERRFSDAVIDSVPGLLYLYDDEGRLVRWNKRHEVITGYSAEELSSMRLLDWYKGDPVSLKRISQAIERVRSHGYAAAEAELQTKFGARIIFYFTAVRMVIDGRTYFTGVGIDITERKRAEQAVRDSEARLSMAAEGGKLGMWEWRVDHDRTIVSDYWLKLKGLTRAQYNQSVHQWYDGLHPEDKARAVELLEQHMRGETEQFDVEYRFAHPTRGWYWEHASGRVVERDAEGKPLRMVGFHQDITERKRTEETLNFLVNCGADAAGCAGEEFFNSLAQYLGQALGMDYVCIDRLEPDGLYAQTLAVNFDGKQLDNVRYALADTPCGELVANSICFHPEGVRRKFPKDQALQDMQAESYAGTVLWGHKGRAIGLIAVISRNPMPDRVHVESMLRLVGVRAAAELERLDAQAQLVASKEAAESANRAKSEFLANMSHEIRTPLNGVLGMLHLLISAELGGELGDYASKAFDASSRLLSLLNDILDFSRIEAGAVTLEAKPFRVAELFNSVSQVFELSCKRKGLAYVLDCDPSVPESLVGDEARIRQILFNLVGNAVKFTSQGEVRISAWARPAAMYSGRLWLHISVADTGIGIPDDKLGHVFERFSQLDGAYTRQYEGAGLGLTIIKRIVDLMHGDLTVESEVGKGTTMHLTLGLAEAEDARAIGHGEDFSRPVPPLKILLAEDEPIGRLAMTVMLTRMGHSVTSVENGKEAVEALKARNFDCVLMDIQMPVMDGVQATRLIRTSAEMADKAAVPIIALTAYAMSGDRERFLAAGLDGHVDKPVQMQELLRAMRQVLGAAGRG